MTFLVFLMGVSLTLNVAVGFVAWNAVQASKRDREALERTRHDVAAMLAELIRIREMSKAVAANSVAEKAGTFRNIIGTALAIYESEQAVAA